ncbi:DUF2285 domain-containing protein [Bradyrhizobium elkanii]|uniref:DUF2285 domain-containing protein n=1 Tax=Bradyrhizobium elkanii TaxID=29448 RepID=UPI0038397A9B
MQRPPRDIAPSDQTLTPYDREHAVTYMRMLEVDAECADWRVVAEIVLRINPKREPQRARRAYETYLARAKWMTSTTLAELVFATVLHGLVYCSMRSVAMAAEE